MDPYEVEARAAWVQFACAALRLDRVQNLIEAQDMCKDASKIADMMLQEYLQRVLTNMIPVTEGTKHK
jgi:hypothetical protein